MLCKAVVSGVSTIIKGGGCREEHVGSIGISDNRCDEKVGHSAHICLMNVAQFIRYARWSRKFMDAYATGLNGEEAAWVVKKYRGHRVLPSQLIQVIDQRCRIHGEPTT